MFLRHLPFFRTTLQSTKTSVPVSVCLITCERYEYTKRTLESFASYNDTKLFQLLHGDDASRDSRILSLAHEFGFETVYRGQSRKGNMVTIRNTVHQANGQWVLLLENDWESVKPFPWVLFDQIRFSPDIYCFRLCGSFKERSGRPFSDLHRGKNNLPANWQRFNGDLEIGDIHWGHTPAVTRKAEMTWLLSGARREKDASLKSGKLNLKTVRVIENIFFHIGELRTPEFIR